MASFKRESIDQPKTMYIKDVEKAILPFKGAASTTYKIGTFLVFDGTNAYAPKATNKNNLIAAVLNTEVVVPSGTVSPVNVECVVAGQLEYQYLEAVNGVNLTDISSPSVVVDHYNELRRTGILPVKVTNY